MKRILNLSILLLCINMIFAQAPQKFSFQAILTNSEQSILIDANVNVRLSILHQATDGQVIYEEIHATQTNAVGMIYLQISTGTSSEDFSAINWANGPYFLKVETDPTGGDEYALVSISQLLSVPYALYADKAGNVFDGDMNNERITNLGTPTEPFDAANKAYVDALRAVIDELQYIVGLSSVSDVNGNTYKTVTIGEQVWMAENLRATSYADGTSLIYTPRDVDWIDVLGDRKRFSYYDSNEHNESSKYGVLYTWQAASHESSGDLDEEIQGICPNGWHLPTLADWNALKTHLSTSASGTEGGELKSIGDDYWHNNVGATNTTKFSARGSGMRGSDANFIGKNNSAYFWASEEHFDDGTKAYAYALRHYDADFSRTGYHQLTGLAVRCIKDNGESSMKPTVKTFNATVGGTTSVMLQGKVIAQGASSVSSRGMVILTDENSATSDGSHFMAAEAGEGEYIVNITTLEENTDYFYCAYASNSSGTVYGEKKSFSTDVATAAVSTTAASNIGETTATVGGNVADNGGVVLITRGIEYATSTNFSANTTNREIDDHNTTGTYSIALSDLEDSTTYYFRAFAENTLGYAYGDTLSFITTATQGGITYGVTDYDGNNYPSVIIGTQEWMMWDLEVTHYANGDVIPSIQSDNDWVSLDQNNEKRAMCDNPNSGQNNHTYYTYQAALNSNSENPGNGQIQGACPTGWHIPSEDEWQTLEIHIGMSSADAASTGWRGTGLSMKLKSDGLYDGWSLHGTDDYGFSAIPGGYRSTSINSGTTFHGWNDFAQYWSSTTDSNDNSNALTRSINEYGAENATIGKISCNKLEGYSVRCIKD